MLIWVATRNRGSSSGGASGKKLFQSESICVP